MQTVDFTLSHIQHAKSVGTARIGDGMGNQPLSVVEVEVLCMMCQFTMTFNVLYTHQQSVCAVLQLPVWLTAVSFCQVGKGEKKTSQ